MLTNCRLCLAKDANFLISNGQAAIRILSCTGLEVNSNDKLPQLICEACRLRLEEFHYFRRRCHEADRRLRHLRRYGETKDKQKCYGDDEEALHLKDVAHCSNTVCSESNALWRKEAVQTIRSEIEAYKKELLGLCKQQVREEIEQQVRKEVEELILAQAKKDCRLSVLDDLFYEMESFFVKKRNETVCELACGSDGFVSDLETAQNDCDVGLSSSIEYADVDPNEMAILEVIDDEPIQQTQTPTVITVNSEGGGSNKETVAEPATNVPLAMVEINMENAQHSHLREDLKSTHFLPGTAAASTTTKERTQQSEIMSRQVDRLKSIACEKIRKLDSPYNFRLETVCKQHMPDIKRQRKSYEEKDRGRDCYRYRLRGSQTNN
ncbi:uncharacterized protein LOC6567468 [Drosophila grimshawi]|uniref:GH23860 n=1 Tax=Drosophila grimshawi TaxID=7222 RepID=B4JTF6_DROGR|nr:uncharacterized protein LOC6567468 [Drosophila grimshawi]EDV95046.1 GH23860 [Drosophila grimshawi]